MLDYIKYEDTYLFIARQVCEKLGYKMTTANISHLLSTHCPDSKHSSYYGVKPNKARTNSVLLTLDEVLILCSIQGNDSSDTLQWLQQEEFEVKIVNNVRDEVSFGSTIVDAMFKNYTIIRQKPVLKYRIDFYIPELNIAVEFDEEQHHTKSGKEADERREFEIKQEIGCTFIRVPH